VAWTGSSPSCSSAARPARPTCSSTSYARYTCLDGARGESCSSAIPVSVSRCSPGRARLSPRREQSTGRGAGRVRGGRRDGARPLRDAPPTSDPSEAGGRPPDGQVVRAG
jgi:hypothetical protein